MEKWCMAVGVRSHLCIPLSDSCCDVREIRQAARCTPKIFNVCYDFVGVPFPPPAAGASPQPGHASSPSGQGVPGMQLMVSTTAALQPSTGIKGGACMCHGQGPGLCWGQSRVGHMLMQKGEQSRAGLQHGTGSWGKSRVWAVAHIGSNGFTFLSGGI